MIYYSMTILWPTIIGTIYAANIITIGWQSSVIGWSTLYEQAIGGFAISYVPIAKYQTIIASCLALAFAASLRAILVARRAAFIAFGAPGCISIGFVEKTAFLGVTLATQPQDIDLATDVAGSIHAAGGAIAEALYLSVFDNKLSIYLPEYVVAAALKAGLQLLQSLICSLASRLALLPMFWESMTR